MDFIIKKVGDTLDLMMKKDEKSEIIESTLMEFTKKVLMKMVRKQGNG